MQPSLPFLGALVYVCVCAAGRRVHEIGERRVLENPGRRIANVQKDLVQRAMGRFLIDQQAQLFCISERRQGSVHQRTISLR